MNQQRSRRFRAAQEPVKNRNERRNCDVKWLKKGTSALKRMVLKLLLISIQTALLPARHSWIWSPKSLRYYINDRINTEPAWQQINVILSDASVPGEGEHKIVDYIRKQRLEPNYDPNQQNVIYGLDADLVMLSMATHESRFHVLREDVFAEDKQRNSNCYFCGKPGHIADKCPERESRLKSRSSPLSINQLQKPFIFL